jgi:hypothetical protein
MLGTVKSVRDFLEKVGCAYILFVWPFGSSPGGFDVHWLAWAVWQQEKQGQTKRAFFDQALSCVSALPGVTHVAVSLGFPVLGGPRSDDVTIPGKPHVHGSPPEVDIQRVRTKISPFNAPSKVFERRFSGIAGEFGWWFAGSSRTR